MSNSQKILKALDKLTSNLPDKFPGMPSEKTVIENYIKKKYPEYNQFQNEADKQAFLKDTYKVVETEVKLHIYTIKRNYSSLKKGIQHTQSSIKAVTTGSLIPSVVAGTGALPNPLYVVQDSSSKGNLMLATLNDLEDKLVVILHSAYKIELNVPDAVLAMDETIETLRKTVLALPTLP